MLLTNLFARISSDLSSVIQVVQLGADALEVRDPEFLSGVRFLFAVMFFDDSKVEGLDAVFANGVVQRFAMSLVSGVSVLFPTSGGIVGLADVRLAAVSMDDQVVGGSHAP